MADGPRLWEALKDFTGVVGLVIDGKDVALWVSGEADERALAAQLPFLLNDDRVQFRRAIHGLQWCRLGPLNEAELWRAETLVQACIPCGVNCGLPRWGFGTSSISLLLACLRGSPLMMAAGAAAPWLLCKRRTLLHAQPRSGLLWHCLPNLCGAALEVLWRPPRRRHCSTRWWHLGQRVAV